MIKSLATALLAALAVLVAQPAPVRVTVSDLLAKPADHYDQHLTVSGILKFNSDGPLLCEFASKANAERHEACIDIAYANSPIQRFDWSKKGALLTIVGYFSHNCPNPDLADKEGIQAICLHRGWRGYINVEMLTISGYATCEGDECAPEEASNAHEVSASDPAAQGIADFAKQLVTAARTRRAENIAALTIPTRKTETLFDLGATQSFDRYYGELANAPQWVVEPGKGFRLFDVDKDEYTARHHELCFCVKGECAPRWSRATKDRDATTFRCHVIWRDTNRWYLIY